MIEKAVAIPKGIEVVNVAAITTPSTKLWNASPIIMSEPEARVALSKVAVGKKHVSRNDEATQERLKKEMRMLLERLKDLAE